MEQAEREAELDSGVNRTTEVEVVQMAVAEEQEQERELWGAGGDRDSVGMKEEPEEGVAVDLEAQGMGIDVVHGDSVAVGEVRAAVA